MLEPDVLLAVVVLHVPLGAEVQRLFQEVATFLEPLPPARGCLQGGVKAIILLWLAGDVRVLPPSVVLQLLRLRSMVYPLVPLRRALRPHAGDQLEPAFDLADAIVEFPGEVNPFREMIASLLRPIGDVSQVRAQLGVRAEHTGALTGESDCFLQPSFDVAGVLEPLGDRPVNLAETVVHALRDLEPLPLQLLPAGERLLERAARLVPSRRAAVLLEMGVAREMGLFVPLRMAAAVPL
jgi:hypothetical protein